MTHVFNLFLGRKGCLNFLQFERYSNYSEQIYHNRLQVTRFIHKFGINPNTRKKT